MKTLIAVSSQSGNTLKIALAMTEAFTHSALLKIGLDEIKPDGYDFVAVGFWLDSGHADSKALNFIKSLKHKKVALFGTLGGDPNSEAAAKVMDETIDNLDKSCMLVGTMWSQGKVSEKVLKKMYEIYPDLKTDKKHLNRIAKASLLPDAMDFDRAFNTALKWKESLNDAK